MTALDPGLDLLRALLAEETHLQRSAAVPFAPLRSASGSTGSGPTAPGVSEPVPVDAPALALLGLSPRVPAGWRIHARYWVLPYLGAPRLLLPRAPRSVLQSALRLYRPQRRLARGLHRGLDLLARAGVAGRLPWHELMVLARDGRELPPSRMWSRLQEALPRARHWAASTGTPGPYRKASLRIMDAHGTPLAQVKLGMRGKPAERIAAETEALARLAELRLQHGRVPAVLAQQHGDAYAWLAQEHLGDDTSGRPSLAQIGDFCVELQLASGAYGVLSESVFWQQLQARLSTLGASLARQGWERVCLPTAQRRMWLGAGHGDLAIYNVLLVHGRLVVFDWETYQAQVPPLLDVLHWLLFEPLLMRSRTPTALADALLHGHEAAQLRGLLQRLHDQAGPDSTGASEDAAPPLPLLLTLYLVDRISRLEIEQRAQPQPKRAAQIGQLAEALRVTLADASRP